MHPILFQIGPLTLRTYGAFIAVAFLVALRVTNAIGRARGIPEKFLMDLALILVLSGLIGARLFYVMINAAYYVQHPWDSLKVWEGGLVFYGGFIVAAVAGVIFARRNRISVPFIADCLVPAVALGQAIGRWGCFFAGCCYGRPTGVPWAVQFKHPASLAPLNIGLHPVQIYEAIGNAAIAAFLWWRLKTKPHAPQGQVFWLYVMLYGILRFGMELLRGDDRGPVFADMYPSQVIALVAILVGATMVITQIASPTDEDHDTNAQNRKTR